jgi:hypothetical protein
MKQTRKRYTLMIAAPLAFDLFGVMSGTVSATYAAEGQPAQSEASPSGEEGGTCCKAGDTTPPTELVKQVPKGQLHSPYPDYAKLAKDDRISSSSSGCRAVTSVTVVPAAAGSAQPSRRASGSGVTQTMCCLDW